MKKSACISYISSRQLCLKSSVKSLWDKFNHKYDYPVYVYYFDDIYDSEEFQENIRGETSDNLHFISVPYKTPSFLVEGELFYNRTNLGYVKSNFSIGRKGYLHMCHFVSNMYGYPNTEYDKYDYVMVHDDEAGYEKEMTCDPFEVLDSRQEKIGAYIVGQRLKGGAPNSRTLETRIGLWKFTKNFLIKRGITPKSKELQDLLSDPEGEHNYHYLKWCDTYVIKNEMFKSDLWGQWIDAVNAEGGIYKYRWGDNEIITLFALIYAGNIYDFGLVEDGTHNQYAFRRKQAYAPSIKNTQV